MNRVADTPRPVFTPLQGQYLAFIHASTLVNGRPPAEHEMMRFFQVTPPTVHRMVVTLEQAGLISRQPATPRSIAVLVQDDLLPWMKPSFAQTVKTSVTRYYTASTLETVVSRLQDRGVPSSRQSVIARTMVFKVDAV